jgi:polyphosphate kinase 2 (PPK2 family)
MKELFKPKNTSINQIFHVLKMFLGITRDKQNKQIAKRTLKSLKRLKNVSLSNVVFRGSKFSFQIQN